MGKSSDSVLPVPQGDDKEPRESGGGECRRVNSEDRKEKARIRAREWYLKNKERASEYRKSYSQRRNFLRNKKRNENTDAFRAKEAKYRDSHREDVRRRGRASHAKNREHRNARSAEWSLAHKDQVSLASRRYAEANKEKIAEYQRVYREKNKEKLVEYRRRYSLENSEVIVARVVKWQRDNPEATRAKIIESAHKRRAQKRGSAVGRVDYAEVHSRNGMKCGICNLPIEGKFHYDHIIPLSKGGPHVTENLQLSHPRCNERKSNKILTNLAGQTAEEE